MGRECARRRAARWISTRAVRRSWRSETAARAGARAKRLGARSTVAAARTVRPPPAGRRCTRRCSSPLAPDPTAMPTMMPPVPSHVPALIIRWRFAPLLQGKTLKDLFFLFHFLKFSSDGRPFPLLCIFFPFFYDWVVYSFQKCFQRTWVLMRLLTN